MKAPCNACAAPQRIVLLQPVAPICRCTACLNHITKQYSLFKADTAVGPTEQFMYATCELHMPSNCCEQYRHQRANRLC
jgi:hypothetical protein